MLIYKTTLPTDTMDVRTIELPSVDINEARGYILKAELQYGEPCVWYDVVNEDVPLTKYLIIAIGTGHPWGNTLSREQYIGTVQLHGGMLVLHYFLVKSYDNDEANV